MLGLQVLFKITLCFLVLLDPSVAKKERILSLDLCSDQWVLSQVPIEDIVGVTYLSCDPSVSQNADFAKKLKTHHGSLEEVALLKPSKIISSYPPQRNIIEHAKSHNIEILVIGHVKNLRDIERIRGLFGNKYQFFMTRKSPQKLAALIMTPTFMGFGVDTIEHEIITSLGLKNILDKETYKGIQPLNREQIYKLKPDIIILLKSDAIPFPAMIKSLNFPVHSKIIHLPPKLLLCPTQKSFALARNHLEKKIQAIPK